MAKSDAPPLDLGPNATVTTFVGPLDEGGRPGCCEPPTLPGLLHKDSPIYSPLGIPEFAPSAHQSAMGALDLSRGRRFRPVLQKTPFGDLPDLEAHVAIVSHEAIEIGFAQHE